MDPAENYSNSKRPESDASSSISEATDISMMKAQVCIVRVLLCV